MKTIVQTTPFVAPLDDEHARMVDYARSVEGAQKLAKAQADIDAGRGIEADDTCFKELKSCRFRRAFVHSRDGRMDKDSQNFAITR